MDLGDTLKIVGICTLIIYIKFLLTTAFQGAFRKRAPEDGAVAERAKERIEQSEDSGFTEEERWNRIVMNDLENIPFGMVLMWASFLSDGNRTTTAVFSIVFAVARIFHSICYVYSLMPWRSICWLFGVISCLGFAINILIGAFNDDSFWNKLSKN